MDKIKFDCNANNAPAYSCNKPGDNSGWYYQVDQIPIEAIRSAYNAMAEEKCRLQTIVYDGKATHDIYRKNTVLRKHCKELGEWLMED